MADRDDWFTTASGRRVYILSPDPEQIHVDDIAHALAHVCRFGGHVRRFYSVAQHSIHVSRLVPPEHARLGLMHDATEAYLGDVIRPLKALLGERYEYLEELWWRAICVAFRLPMTMPPCIKQADVIALVTERRDLVTTQGAMKDAKWKEDELGHLPDPVRIVPWEPNVARVEFLHRWDQLR